MGLTLQLVVLLGLSAGLLMGADARCSKRGECCMKCAEGWAEFNDRCFYFDAALKDWCDAEKACQALGGNLASILDISELGFIRKLVVRSKGHAERTWLGATDAVKEGCWIWTSGHRYSFNGWATNEPNNQGHEHCMEIMSIANQGVNDAPCKDLKAYVCVTDLEKRDKGKGSI